MLIVGDVMLGNLLRVRVETVGSEWQGEIWDFTGEHLLTTTGEAKTYSEAVSLLLNDLDSLKIDLIELMDKLSTREIDLVCEDNIALDRNKK